MIRADRVRRESDPRRADEARWVLECLLRHAETRLKEIQELAKQEPDIALEDLKPLVEQFKGTSIGQRLAGEAAALEAGEAMARCRRAREIWKRVLAESNKIEVPDGIGHEHWNHFVPMPEDIQKKYHKEPAAIKSGVDEMLAVYSLSHPLKARLHDGPEDGSTWCNGWRCDLFILGQSRSRTILKLKNRWPGFDDTARPHAVLITGSTGHGHPHDKRVGGWVNEAFQNTLKNFTIEVGRGNPGAVGVDFLASNRGALEEVTIRAPEGSGFCGVDMTRP